jgi:hypothetical protein
VGGTGAVETALLEGPGPCILTAMLYTILCYDSEEEVGSWTEEQDQAAISKLTVVTTKLANERRLGPVARLARRKAATVVKKGPEARVLDGPFAETKEVLLGFYVVECATREVAIETARELARASSSSGSFEVRPLTLFLPGTASSEG